MASIIRPTHVSNNNQQQLRWHAFSTVSALEHEAAQKIIECANLAINQRGSFRIVLAGGSTPRNVYAMLRGQNTEWQHWHIYFSDERCLPPEHEDRNSMMAKQTWLNHVDIPTSQIHAIPAELGADTAANHYSRTLLDIDLFDLVLLGLGEDGHTASLFPLHEWGSAADAASAIGVHNAPKPPADRVSLSAHRLSQTRQMIFLVSGMSKQSAINAWLNGGVIPASAMTPACGVDIYLDQTLLDQAMK